MKVIPLFAAMIAACALSAKEIPDTAHGEPMIHRAVVPVTGRVVGWAGIEWIGSVTLYNDSAEEVFVGLTMLTANQPAIAFSVAPGELIDLDDVGGEILGTQGILAPLLVNSLGPSPIRVTARAFAVIEGRRRPPHDVPVISPERGAGVLFLSGLTFTDSKRVNLGIENLGEEPVEVTVSIQLIEGRNIATAIFVVPPETLYHAPIQTFFPLLTKAGNMTIVVDTPADHIYAYATVVDNVSHEASFVSPRLILRPSSVDQRPALHGGDAKR